MPTYIALLRGIGGKRTFPMQRLVDALEELGLDDVRTYIASGNAIFRSRKSADQLSKTIERCIERTFGFTATTIVLSVPELTKAARGNPFPQAEQEPTSLHVFFLAAPAKSPDLEAMQRLKLESEAFVLKKQVFYFHAPSGFGTSKLGARIEKLLGVPTTARNWRTVTNLLSLAHGRD